MTQSAVPAYLRFPHVQGELVAFTAEDDVWLAPLGGGRAWRVSADNVPVTQPRVSPDGTTVAWTSTRDGAPEVHVAPVDGGPARRLTHWGSWTTRVRGWTPDGQVLALTSHGQATLRRTWAHAVPLDGGPATRLPYGPVGGVAYGPHTVLLSAPMGREAAAWKRYRGGTAGKLWIDRSAPDGEVPGEFVRLHEELDGNVEHPAWVGDRIAFLSDHEGTGALYSSLADGSDLRRHTPLDGFYARHAASDGTRVVYCSAGELWLLDDLDGAEPRRLDVRLGGQRADRQPFPVNASRWFGSASPDHTARGSAVAVRGGVHWVTHRSGPARALAAEPGVRARLPRTYRAEGEEWVVWVTDAEGEDALEFAPATGLTPGSIPRRLAAGQLGRVLALAMAPDGSRAAVASHDGRLLLVERETGEVREVDRSEDGDVRGLVFSPDSAWLAWSHPGPRPLCQLKLANTTDLSVTEATPLRFQDYAPAFTADGKHLAFLSNRSFDPVYDEHVFDLAFVVGDRPHLITLAATTPSPFGPQRHGRPFETPDKDETPRQRGHADDTDRPRRARRPDRAVPGGGRALLQPARREGRRAVAAPPRAGRARLLPGHPGRPRPQDRAGALRPRPAAPGAPRGRRRPLRGQRRRQAGAAVDRRPAEGRTERPARLRRRRQRHQRHRRPRPRPPDGRPGGRVAADVRRDRPHHARPLLARGHERRRLGRRPGPLPAGPRPGRHPRRPGGPPVGGAGRAGHLARLRHPARRPRGRRPAGTARRGHLPPPRRQLAHRPGPARGDLRPRRPLAPGRPPASRCAPGTRSWRWPAGRWIP
ncbi:hypothetical protein GCM10020295_55570 [Streptomyces cinereospinus]